jgi:small conductance mechanosensitive channel
MPASRFATSTPDLWSIAWLRTNGVHIAVVVTAALAMSTLGSLAIRRMRRRLEATPSATGAINLRRTATIVGILTSAFRVVIWTLVGFLVLGELGIDLGPLIAGAGIVGLALGFGAQSLVRDFLSGFFILLENQFTVGDAVELTTDVSAAKVAGRVEALTLRTTAIRGPDGSLLVIPNGNLHIVSNRSRGQADVEVEVRVARGDDPEEVRILITALCREMREDERFAARVFSGPEVIGVDQIDAETVILRVGAATSPARADEIRDEIAKRIDRRMAPVPSHVELVAP